MPSVTNYFLTKLAAPLDLSNIDLDALASKAMYNINIPRTRVRGLGAEPGGPWSRGGGGGGLASLLGVPYTPGDAAIAPTPRTRGPAPSRLPSKRPAPPLYTDMASDIVFNEPLVYRRPGPRLGPPEEMRPAPSPRRVRYDFSNHAPFVVRRRPTNPGPRHDLSAFDIPNVNLRRPAVTKRPVLSGLRRRGGATAPIPIKAKIPNPAARVPAAIKTTGRRPVRVAEPPMVAKK